MKGIGGGWQGEQSMTESSRNGNSFSKIWMLMLEIGPSEKYAKYEANEHLEKD